MVMQHQGIKKRVMATYHTSHKAYMTRFSSLWINFFLFFLKKKTLKSCHIIFVRCLFGISILKKK
jgi:hypothetical protein